MKEMKYFWNIYSAEGVKADPDKISAITAMMLPETKTDKVFPWHGELFTAVLA